MLTYNFMAQFAPLVESGEKDCTIRAKGKRRPPKPGEHLRLFTGMRTKKCRKLGDFICDRVRRIEIMEEGTWMEDENGYWGLMGRLSESRLARRDGHADVKAFRAFFVSQVDDGLFFGNLIEWRKP